MSVHAYKYHYTYLSHSLKAKDFPFLKTIFQNALNLLTQRQKLSSVSRKKLLRSKQSSVVKH
jgi:hypothetical protein